MKGDDSEHLFLLLLVMEILEKMYILNVNQAWKKENKNPWCQKWGKNVKSDLLGEEYSHRGSQGFPNQTDLKVGSRVPFRDRRWGPSETDTGSVSCINGSLKGLLLVWNGLQKLHPLGHAWDGLGKKICKELET